MVSKVCHSQLSSSTLARAAHIPPCAAPVWERVGYSLEITAVLARPDASRAARSPAPPAPTITTSKECCWVMASTPACRPHRLRTRREREDRQGAQHPGEADDRGVQALVRQAAGAAAGVVVDD